MINSPIEQFKVNTYLNIYNNFIDFSINKTNIYLIISIFLIITIYKTASAFRHSSPQSGWGIAGTGPAGINNNQTIYGTTITKNNIGKNSGWISEGNIKCNKGNKILYIIETIYLFWQEQLKDLLGKEGKRYINIIISIFTFILVNNVIGMVPYSYSITTQIIITISFSLIVIISVTLNGFLLHGFSFFKLFIPENIPKLMIPFLFTIELISYLFRIISLAVRLTGNIIAGHTTIKIISSFSLQIFKLKVYWWFLLIIPFVVIFLLIGLEFGVCLIQSYVFTVLIINYIKDSIFLH